MKTLGRLRIAHWIHKMGFPNPSSIILELLNQNSSELLPQQTPFPKEHLLATLWTSSSTPSPLLPQTSPLCTCLPLEAPTSTLKLCRRHSNPVLLHVSQQAAQRKSQNEDPFSGFPCTCRRRFPTTDSRDAHIYTEMS